MSHNVLSKNLLSLGKLAFGIAYFAAAGSASAGSGAPLLPSVDPWLSVNCSGSLSCDMIQAGGTNDGLNDFSFSGSASTTGYSIDWSLNVNPDPFVNGSFTITNLSGLAQNFTVNLTLPVTPSFGSGLMGGSIDATVFDFNNDATATLKPQGSSSNPIYFGRIDGVNVLPMFAQVLNCSGSLCSANSGESQMPPSIPVAGVSSTIGTRLVFNLSAGDQATFLTHFEVTPVPLPASAWLMGSALLGFIGVRRRR